MKPRAIAALAGLVLLSWTPALAQAPSQMLRHDGLPFKNGNFSAMMVIIPEKMLSEFDKPSSQAPVITPQRQAKVGDVVAVKLIFAGPQRDASGMIDVTYDIRILDPDGKPYGGADGKGLTAAKLAMPTEGGILDNRQQVLAIGFEAKDKPGRYTAEAVLHDNVAHRDIPLTASIELLPGPPMATSAAQGS